MNNRMDPAAARPGAALTHLDLSVGDVSRYSLRSAILQACQHIPAGLESECSTEIGKRLNGACSPGQIYIPNDVQERRVPLSGRGMGYARRDLTAASASGGGYLMATNNMSLIEVLRNRSVAYRMGARRLAGLVGNVTMPRQTAAATAVWLANESSTATESAQTLGQLTLSPKTVGAYTEISRQLLLQSSPDAEGMVTADLGSVCALAVDAGAIRGSGSAGQITGIVNTAGIGAVSGSSLAYAGVRELQKDVAGAGVTPVAGGYVTTATVADLMMERVKFASTASPIWEGNLWDGTMAGCPAMSSGQLVADTMLFGDWDQLVIGEWGVLRLEVNPYANFQAGIVGVRCFFSADAGLRHPGAFSLASSIT